MSEHTSTKELTTAARRVVDHFDSNMIERLFFTFGAGKAFWIASAVEKLRDAIAKAEGEVQP